MSEGVTCDDCYMRLQRQATEWGKKYKFRFYDQVTRIWLVAPVFLSCNLVRSCADLKIVADENTEEVKKISWKL